MILTKDKSFYKTLALLAIPIALQNLVTFSLGLIDNLMIGSLGDDAISGVYMANQIQTLLQIFSGGIEGALLVLAAQYFGKRDTDSMKKIVSVAFKFSFVFSLLATLISAIFPKFVLSAFTNDSTIISVGTEYLQIVCYSYVLFSVTQVLIAAMRSVERAKIGLYVSSVSLAINAVLNYILIFGKLGAPALGVRGAAIATLIARIVECAITVVYVMLIDKKLEFKFSDVLKSDTRLTRDFIKYGLPIIAGQLVWAANILSNSAIMGRQSADGVVAALSIANTMNNLAYVVMNGMAGAVGIITGKTIGSGNEKLMREYAKTTQIIFLALGLITGASVFAMKNALISLYNVSDAARRVAVSFINVLAITIIGTSYQMPTLAGLVKAGGDISFVFKQDLIFVFLVVIPSALIATRLHLAPWIVFLCLKSDQILKCIVAVIKVNSFNWMKNLTRESN